VVDRVASHAGVTQLAPGDYAMLTFGELRNHPINRTSSSGGHSATNSKFGGHGRQLGAQKLADGARELRVSL
jgi:hypothetical protein